MPDPFAGCKTIMWYDQYCENYYRRGFKDYTPEAVLRDLDVINADIYAVYATNQWGLAYYPSAVLPRPPELLEHDYVGEICAGLKERGKKIIAYTNWLDSRHPEWQWQKLSRENALAPLPQDLVELPEFRPQGKGPVFKVGYGEWFYPCINSPRRQEIVQVAREIVDRYPVDAFHLDMFFNWGICGCERCRPQLEAILGTDEITYQGICDHWDDYLAWRQEVSTSLMAELAEVVHAKGVGLAPNAFCPIYVDPQMAVNPGWWEHIDSYVTEAWLRLSPNYSDSHSTTIVSKWLQGLKLPGLVLVTGQHPGFSHAPLAEPEYRMHAVSLLGNGRPVLGSCGQGAYPTGRNTEAALQTMGRVFAQYSAEVAPIGERQPVKQIAVVWSEDSRNFYEWGEEATKCKFEFLGFCRALLEGHRIFDVILPERVGGAADLAGYELVILPNVACMDEALAEALRQYAAAGGKLLATWDSGMCDRRGRRRARGLLEEVLGVQAAEAYPWQTFYVERPLEPSVCIGGALRVRAQGAEVLSRLVEPDPDYPDEGQMTDLVPGPLSDWPLLTRHRYGQGTAWYLAGSVGYSAYKTGYYQTHEILADLFAGLELTRRVELDAPPTVELSLEQDAAGTLYAHLGNQTVPAWMPGRQIVRSIDAIIPVADLRLRLYGDYRPEDVAPLEGLTVRAIAGGVECALARLDDHAVITVRAAR